MHFLGDLSTYFLPPGHYLYFEASFGQQGDNAWLVSQYIPATDGNFNCLAFWYHMFGESKYDLGLYSMLPPSSGNNIVNTRWHSVLSQTRQTLRCKTEWPSSVDPSCPNQ